VTSGGSTFTLVRTLTVIIGACTSSTVRGFGAKMNQDSRDSDDDIVITPGGPMSRSTTHRVRPGGEVRQEADGSAQKIANVMLVLMLMLRPCGARW
jgi:hypothetical protein